MMTLKMINNLEEEENNGRVEVNNEPAEELEERKDDEIVMPVQASKTRRKEGTLGPGRPLSGPRSMT